MKLRFSVDQAEAFRQGIDIPQSIVTVDVTPSKLDQETRNLIADRLEGINVCLLRLEKTSDKKRERVKSYREKLEKGYPVNGSPYLIEASAPTFEALMEAIRENEEEMEAKEREGGLLTMDEAMKMTGLSEEDLRAGSNEPPTLSPLQAEVASLGLLERRIENR